jgi:hypothetical protein
VLLRIGGKTGNEERQNDKRIKDILLEQTISLICLYTPALQQVAARMSLVNFLCLSSHFSSSDGVSVAV